jgi:putative addiction module component (TIGR02574 family)
MSTKEIIEAALKLDPVERARLADTIWHSLSEAEIEAIEDAEDVVEAQAILARMKKNREQPIPWEDVKRRLGLG